MGIIQEGLAVRLEYLNNSAYLFHEDYGWWDETLNRPTSKLMNLIKMNDNITKNKWGNIIPNESFINTNYSPLFDIVIPTYWDVMAAYPSSNGIGYGEHLKLDRASSWDDIDELRDWYVPPTVFLNPSSVPIDTPNDQYINYLPVMEPGFGYINDTKFYVFPNKVTYVINAHSNQSLYYIDTKSMGNGYPVYIYKNNSVTYNDVKSALVKYDEIESGEQLRLRSIQFNYNDETAIVDNIQPYIPMQIIDDKLSYIELSYSTYKLIGNTLTNIIKDYDYINLTDGFLYIHEPFDGVIILTYNEAGFDDVVIKNVDLSPITWDADDRVLSIIDQLKEPYTIYIIQPINTINNVDTEVNLTVVVKDSDNVPVDNITLAATEVMKLEDLSGNDIAATIEEVTYNGDTFYKIYNIPVDTDILLNNSIVIGRIHQPSEYLLIYKSLDILTAVINTNKYGAADIKIQSHETRIPFSNIQYYIKVSHGTYESTYTLVKTNNINFTPPEDNIMTHTAPITTRQTVIDDYNNNTITTQEFIWGGYVRAYTLSDWDNDIDNYIHIPAYNGKSITTIDASSLSGTYVLQYDVIQNTWGTTWN